MALAVDGFHGPEPDTILRAQRSFLAVSEVDRFVLTGSGGNLQPFLPLDPFHGVHRAYAWQGVGSPHFVQVNAAATRHDDGRYDWNWPAAQVHSYQRLFIIAAIEDAATGRLQNPAWIYPSTALRRLAYLSRGQAGHPQYWIEASPTGHDRFARHRISLAKIWEKLAPTFPARGQTAAAYHESHRDEGTVYEQLVAADWLRQSDGHFAVYRPGMDIAGRDLLVQLVDTRRAIFVQVKGTIQVVDGARLQWMVKRWTFRPSKDFWLGFYYFDAAAGAFWKYCWLVPSLEFAALTADQHFARTLSCQVTLEGESNRWRRFRHEIDAQGAVLRQALLALPR